MPRNKIRQQSQVKSSDTFNDLLTASASYEATDSNLEQDLNALRSQVNRILAAVSASGNWYDDVPLISGSRWGLKELATSLGNLGDRKVIYGVHVNVDVPIPSGQNFVVLTASLNHHPTASAAVSANSLGAVIALLPGDVGAWSNALVSGANALTPKNLVRVRDAATKFPLTTAQSGTIYGLLQAESTVADGDTFNDTTKQVQLSFVTARSGSDTLVSASITDVAGRIIEYAYPLRSRLNETPDDFLYGHTFFTTQLINTASGGGTGNGTITGPTASVNNSIARWSGVGGTTITDSPVQIDNSGNITVPGGALVDGRDVGIDGNKLDALVLQRWHFDAIAFDNPDTSGDWPTNTVVATIDVDAVNTGLRNRLFTENSGTAAPLFQRAVATPPFCIPSGTTNFRFEFWTRPVTAPTASVTSQFMWAARSISDNAAVSSWTSLTNFTAFAYSSGNTTFQKDTETVSITTLGLTASQMGQLVIARNSDALTDEVTGSVNLLMMKMTAI